MSSIAMSLGSAFLSAASISPRSSRSSGSMYSRSSASKRAFSLRIGPCGFPESSYSFKLMPRSSARERTRTLWATLPVK